MKDVPYILKLNRIRKKVCSLCQQKLNLGAGFINLLGSVHDLKNTEKIGKCHGLHLALIFFPKFFDAFC